MTSYKHSRFFACCPFCTGVFYNASRMLAPKKKNLINPLNDVSGLIEIPRRFALSEP